MFAVFADGVLNALASVVEKDVAEPVIDVAAVIGSIDDPRAPAFAAVFAVVIQATESFKVEVIKAEAFAPKGIVVEGQQIIN